MVIVLPACDVCLRSYGSQFMAPCAHETRIKILHDKVLTMHSGLTGNGVIQFVYVVARWAGGLAGTFMNIWIIV